MEFDIAFKAVIITAVDNGYEVSYTNSTDPNFTGNPRVVFSSYKDLLKSLSENLVQL